MGEHQRNAGEPPSGDYPVGYKRTPAKNRFRPGQSGNPSGRPKKVKSEKDVLVQVLATTFPVQGPDGPVSMEPLEVIIRRMIKDAADGKASARKALFDRLDANGIGTDPLEPALDDEEKDIAIRLLAEYGELFSQGKESSDVED